MKKDFQEINQLLHEHNYPEFEPKDGLNIDDVQENWSNLERAEKEREEALKLKHNLREMEEAYTMKSGDLVAWLKDAIEKANKRDFPKTAAECLKIATQEANLKKVEKPKKAEIRDELQTEYGAINNKIRKESHPEFKVSDEQTPPGIAALWDQLEKAESERASALANEQVRLGDEGSFFFFLLFFSFI